MSKRQQTKTIQPTYYDVLGVSSNATDTDIKLAYRRLVMFWHPDKRIHTRHIAEQNLKNINEAYSHLKTHAARLRYDHVLHLQQKTKHIAPSTSRKHSKWGQFWNWLTMLESNSK